MKLVWFNLAREELQELRTFSVGRWDRDIAQRYLEDVRAEARQMGVGPERAKPLKGLYRILRVRSHYLIVHVDPAGERITIARVLHAAVAIERHLP